MTLGQFLVTIRAISVEFEWIVIEVPDRGACPEAKPTLPLLATGITPVLQWLLPPLIVWLVRRRLT